MHQLQTNKVLNINAYVFNKTKKDEKIQKNIRICSMLYFTVFKNIIKFIEQINKILTKNNIVSKKFRI